MSSVSAIIEKSSIIVIKIGTVLIAEPDGGGVKKDWLSAFAQDVAALKAQGKSVVIVSSGAVALGRRALGIPLDLRPGAIPLEKKQAASAVGQYHVFDGFHTAFAPHALPLAQVLLTMSETENRKMHLNARATLNALLDAGVIPVINENDTISTGEIRFGDNDRLAARVAQMIEAQAVILLSTTDGLYSDNPDTNKDAQHFAVVENVGPEHLDMAGEAVPGMSTGGMKSKVEAARAANSAGIDLIIANGYENHALDAVLNNENTRTTLFKASNATPNSKKRWLISHLAPKGIAFIDKGALKALKDGKSLLPVGVKSIQGHFDRGDVVEIQTEDGQKLGMGISAYSSIDAQKIVGLNSQDTEDVLGYVGRAELVHRNDMVLQES